MEVDYHISGTPWVAPAAQQLRIIHCESLQTSLYHIWCRVSVGADLTKTGNRLLPDRHRKDGCVSSLII